MNYKDLEDLVGKQAEELKSLKKKCAFLDRVEIAGQGKIVLTGGSLKINATADLKSLLDGSRGAPVEDPIIDHTLLENLNSTNYTHLTEEHHDELTGGEVTDLHGHNYAAGNHEHDDQYSPLSHGHEASDISDFSTEVQEICNALYVALASGKAIGLSVFEDGDEVGISTGLIGIPIGPELNGLVLSSLTAVVGAAGTGSTTDVIVRRRRVGGADTYMMTSATKIASGAVVSSNGVPDTANDDVLTGDMLFIDVTGANTYPPSGLSVTLNFIQE